MYDHPEIIQSYDNWIDLKLLREQYKKGKVIAAYKEPWYGEYDTKAVADRAEHHPRHPDGAARASRTWPRSRSRWPRVPAG